MHLYFKFNFICQKHTIYKETNSCDKSQIEAVGDMGVIVDSFTTLTAYCHQGFRESPFNLIFLRTPKTPVFLNISEDKVSQKVNFTACTLDWASHLTVSSSNVRIRLT